MSKKDQSSDTSGGFPLPSPKPATNLLIADIVLRGAGRTMRGKLEKRMLVSKYDPDTARDLIDGQTVLSSMMIYGASKLAARSPAGLAVVAGGLALKTLYDRGKARQKRDAQAQTAKKA